MSLDKTWHNALLAQHLLAVDPGLGGLILRARAGPVRDAFLAACRAHHGAMIRLHPAMTDDTLLGGLDLAATLSGGRIITKQGLLQGKTPYLLAMAERADPAFAARIAAHLDGGGGPVIACDEGATVEEAAHPALADRLAFRVDLTDVALSDIGPLPPVMSQSGAVTCHTDDMARITQIAALCGIDSLRAPLLALRAAKAHARLSGRTAVSEDDITAACALVLAHRATQLPQPDDPPVTPPEIDTDTGENGQNDGAALPDELILDAIRALLPDDLLDRVATARARRGTGNGSGATRKGNRRGRPLPSRAGRKADNARIDLMATLRAAAPWQTIRRRATGQDRLHIRAADICTKRYAVRSDRLLIFTVDASGSAALARLAEAKGAVELLLAQAYARRDHVALVAFRGETAELLLPPTRSLVQTKRRLAALPGGGGTPLAAGLETALAQALQARQRGLTPTVCVLTDGRANIARDGTADRARAGADAQTIAQTMRAQGIEALIIDTGNRPAEALKTLAQTLSAPYLPLPRADANRLSAAVTTALGE